jgi:hypothetical protein
VTVHKIKIKMNFLAHAVFNYKRNMNKYKIRITYTSFNIKGNQNKTETMTKKFMLFISEMKIYVHCNKRIPYEVLPI